MRYGNFTTGEMGQFGNFNDVIHHRLAFGRQDAGVSLIEAKEFRLFSNGVGQTEKNISTGADFTLTPADSSQDGRGGTIPNAQSFVIAAIGIKVTVPNIQPTVARTNDAVNTVDVTPVVQMNSIPLVQTLMEQCTFELWKNASIRLERGGLLEYPCEFGLQGFSGGSNAVPALAAGVQTAYNGNVTLVQSNGMMFRALTVYQILESLDEFYGVFEPRVNIDLEDTFLCGYIDFYLVGLLAQDYIAKQYYDQFVGA